MRFQIVFLFLCSYHFGSVYLVFQADLYGRTQEMTSALLCSFCTLLSLRSSDMQVLKEKIVTLAGQLLFY